MSAQTIDLLILTFSTGFGLVAAVGAMLLCQRCLLAVRVLAGGLGGVSAGILPLALDYPGLALPAVALVAVSTLVVRGLSSRSLLNLAGGALHRLQQPAYRSGALILAGLSIMSCSLAWYSWAEEAAIDRDMAWMAGVGYQPDLRPAPAHLTTDGGRPLDPKVPDEQRSREEMDQLEQRVMSDHGYADRVIHLAPPMLETNCHGWVFTGGKYWLTGTDVEKILTDNGYVAVSRPRPGDLAVYRMNDQIAHTAVVRYVGEAETLVESKWGWMGVYLHPATGSMYGQEFTYYRSQRDGHLIAGLTDSPAPPYQVTVPVESAVSHSEHPAPRSSGFLADGSN